MKQHHNIIKNVDILRKVRSKTQLVFKHHLIQVFLNTRLSFGHLKDHSYTSESQQTVLSNCSLQISKVVLQRANLRNEGEEDPETDGQMIQLQLAQLVGVAVLLCAM